MPAVVKSSGDLLADRRYEYARSLAARGDAASAAALFAEAAAQAPHWPAAWRALGETRLALGDGEGAADAFRRCLALDPADEAGAALHLARIEHAPLPAIAPRAYVAALFDAYAEEFDASLLARLDYHGHEIVAAAAAGRRYDRALDLGCGTGLAGVLLKPLTRHLEGVDLSARMIETARRRGVYDRLSIASLEERLAASDAEFDLIAAADVLCYIGDLAPVMAALARALRPGGRAVFTLERSPGAAVELRPSLRFSHGEDHVRRVAEEAGLAVGRISLERLRTDAGAPVEGLSVVLSRGASSAGPLAKPDPWATSTP